MDPVNTLMKNIDAWSHSEEPGFNGFLQRHVQTRAAAIGFLVLEPLTAIATLLKLPLEVGGFVTKGLIVGTRFALFRREDKPQTRKLIPNYTDLSKSSHDVSDPLRPDGTMSQSAFGRESLRKIGSKVHSVERRLPNFFDFLNTIQKIVDYVLGTIFTALFWVFPQINIRMHHKLGLISILDISREEIVAKYGLQYKKNAKEVVYAMTGARKAKIQDKDPEFPLSKYKNLTELKRSEFKRSENGDTIKINTGLEEIEDLIDDLSSLKEGIQTVLAQNPKYKKYKDLSELDINIFGIENEIEVLIDYKHFKNIQELDNSIFKLSRLKESIDDFETLCDLVEEIDNLEKEKSEIVRKRDEFFEAKKGAELTNLREESRSYSDERSDPS